MKIPFSDVLPSGVCSFSAVGGELIDCRAKSRLPQNAESIIVYLFPYYLGEEYYKNSNISKYAVPADYHLVLKDYLDRAVKELENDNPGFEFEAFCDNSPIKEVKAAAKAGLGVIGENGLLINKVYGSWCFIGEIVTNMYIEPAAGEIGECMHCKRCLNMCAGDALCEGAVEKQKCLSDITQKKGELSPDDTKLIKKHSTVWGCDICQNVCPMNKNAAVTPIKEFYNTAKGIYKFGDYKEDRAYSWRPKSVIDRNLEILCCKPDENKL